MRKTTKAVAAAALAALALAGCEFSVGNITKVPKYVEVEAEGVTLEVLDGMVESAVPEGFDSFWKNDDDGAQVSVGITMHADEATFLDERVEWLGSADPDLTTKEAAGGALAFEATGVDDETFTGLIAVRDGVGVVVSAGEGIAEGVAEHIVDSVKATGEAGSDDAASDDAASDDAASDDAASDDESFEDESFEDDTDAPMTTTVWTDDDRIMVDVLEGMEEYPSDLYDGLWQTPAGSDPQVTVSVVADVDPETFLQEQATAISNSMEDPMEIDETEDRYLFTGVGVDGEMYTVLVGVNGSVGVVASSGPGLSVSVLNDLVDSAW